MVGLGATEEGGQKVPVSGPVACAASAFDLFLL